MGEDRRRTDAPTPATSETGRPPKVSRLVVGAGVLLGVALRVGIHATALGRPDSDEVVSALMVRHLGDTGFPWFVWGQHYGGTAQLLPVVASTTIFGDNLLGLRVPNLVLAAVNAWLLYRLARRSMDERWAVLAGLLVWVGPAASVWFGIHEQLFYPPSTTMGLGILLLAHRMVQEPGRIADAAGLGFLCGLGWWTGTNVVYFAVPAVLWGAGVVRRSGRRWWGEGGVLGPSVTALLARVGMMVGLFVVGASPWLLDVAINDGAPLHATETFPRLGTFPLRIAYLFREALPGSIGGRDVLSHDWAWGPLGALVTGAVFGLLAVGLWQAVRGRTWDAFAFGWFVLVYASIGWSPDDPNLRYTFAAAPILASLAARGLTWFADRRPALTDRRWTAVALASLLIASGLTASSMVRLHDLSEHGGTVYRVGNVPDLDEVIAVLDEQGITRVWADYWVAYRLVYETGGRIVSSPAAGITRYEPYAETVVGAARLGWVALRGVQADALLAAMASIGVEHRRVDLTDFVVVIPVRAVHPGELPEAARRAPETPRPTL